LMRQPEIGAISLFYAMVNMSNGHLGSAKK
jgi:hypothetical protein